MVAENVDADVIIVKELLVSELKNGEGTDVLDFTSFDNVKLTAGTHLVFDSSNGNNVATEATQKIGFWGQTPVVQQAVASDANVATLIVALSAMGIVGEA